MTSLKMEFDAVDDGFFRKPAWQWRLCIDGVVVASGVEPFFPLARRSAEAAWLATL
jgi:hypothetical protein